MKAFIKKLSSRKFLTCIAGVVLGICMIFGLDEGTVSTIAGAVTAVASVISYIIAEGKIDAAAVGDAADKVTEVIDAVEKIED
jgi:phage shock protein PspC (stress-responsive transcriptional regulator)